MVVLIIINNRVMCVLLGLFDLGRSGCHLAVHLLLSLYQDLDLQLSYAFREIAVRAPAGLIGSKLNCSLGAITSSCVVHVFGASFDRSGQLSTLTPPLAVCVLSHDLDLFYI